ncbi:MAG: TniB family NTP-binding protein [Hydrogenophaga sp.]|nr:TniB family NTP-binding protein [Hydrogenophaga sp.]
MTSKLSKNTFSESTSLDSPEPVDLEVNTRRLQTYSIEALRVGRVVERIYVNHPAFVRGLRALDRLFQMGTEMEAPHGCRLIGPPGSGKTALFRYFQESLPQSALFTSDLGVVGLRVPKTPQPGLLIREFLRMLRYPFAAGSYKQLYERRQLVFEALAANRTRLVWLDEAHHLLPRHISKQREREESESIELLRELMDVCRVSLVLAGSSELDNLPSIAPHFASRIASREALDVFPLDINWLGFLKAFSSKITVFDGQLIADRKFGTLLHIATDGNLRGFKQLIVESILIAYDNKQLSLTPDNFAQAFRLVFGHACSRNNPFDAAQ